MASEVEKILIEFANKVLDVRNGKGNPTLGELVDEPEQALSTYIDSVVEQVIGEDEKEIWYNKDLVENGNDYERKFLIEELPKRSRNELRAELRHRYEQMKGGV